MPSASEMAMKTVPRSRLKATRRRKSGIGSNAVPRRSQLAGPQPHLRRSSERRPDHFSNYQAFTRSLACRRGERIA